jgi:hypothetical protein
MMGGRVSGFNMRLWTHGHPPRRDAGKITQCTVREFAMTEKDGAVPQAMPATDADAPARRAFEDLPPAARRALKEAEERSAARKAAEAKAPKEIGGRGGLDPVRYGDWEVKGRAIDF